MLGYRELINQAIAGEPIETFSPQEKNAISYYPNKPDSRSFIMDIENTKEDSGYEPKYNYIEYLQD